VNKQCLPKQEIIDNLRLELRERDLILINMSAKMREAVNLLQRAQNQIEDDILYADIAAILPELER
jgi:hypothetical protein